MDSQKLLNQANIQDIEDIQDISKENSSFDIQPQDVEEQTDDTINIDFGEANLLDDFDTTKAQPVEEEEEEKKENQHQPTVKELKKKIISEENEENQQFDVSDFELFSTMIIEAIAYGFGWILCYIAQSNDTNKYEPTKERNKKLSNILTKVLVKANIKFSFTSAFVLMLLVTYGTLTATAIKDRKTNKHKKKTKTEPIIIKPPQKKENIKTVENTENQQKTQITQTETEVKTETVKTETEKKEVKKEAVTTKRPKRRSKK